MKISHNLASISAWNSVSKNDNKLHKSVEKLSTGLKINRASDDASGLSISAKMWSQVNCSTIASRTCQDAIYLLQTAEDSISSINDILNRLRSLTIQSGSGVYSNDDINHLQSEVNELINQIISISNRTSYNGLSLLDGTYSGINSLIFQIGANDRDSMRILIVNCNPDVLGANNSNAIVKNLSQIDLFSLESRRESLNVIDNAISEIVLGRASLGAYANRIEFIVNLLTSSNENMSATGSRLTNVNMATEIANQSRLSFMSESGMSTLAQSNQKTQSIIQLIN